MKAKCLTLMLLLAAACQPMTAQREKTTFQTAGPWKPSTDVRADVVMVYGANDRQGQSFRQRVDSWRDHGYTTHYMTGIAWGGYQDYFTGQWDGRPHMDEGQKTRQGDTIMHGPSVPYIVPTLNYLRYFCERHIRPAIDAGIDAIFLEEPEFWMRGGYSEAFQREWRQFYGTEWRPQHESAENTYLSNKLKYHLYHRALDSAFTYAKRYGEERGMKIRCYVPTHSLINYAQWGIVSPEASLASLESCDGYIAQVWTGTSRAPNIFQGKHRERVFETAFLEYGCMESMTRPTGRKMFFLTDPIEDGVVDWEDYRRNYQATFVAQLLYPTVADYEVMPWPERIYERLYRISSHSEEQSLIPRPYSTQMQVMINALGKMPASNSHVSGQRGISVLMANSIMFQPSVEGPRDSCLSNFFGLTLPLVKRGIPVSITHIENTAHAETWRDVNVLLMSYAQMKPLHPKAHEDIARWVNNGGTLVYCGRDDDPYQRVSEWWNTDGFHYDAPSQHLFALMNMPEQPADGHYRFGRGHVYVLRHNPCEFATDTIHERLLLEVLNTACGELQTKNNFMLRRGPYLMAAVVDEGAVSDAPLVLSGRFIDLFNPQLPVITKKTVFPGEQSFLFDINQVRNRRRPQILAAASRQEDEHITRRSYSFVARSPLNTDNVMRILLPREPKTIRTSASCTHQWDAHSRTLLLRFENDPAGVHVQINW